MRDLEAKNLELARAKDRAEAAVHARDEFLIIASHELRTPLTSLQLQLQSIRRALDGHGAAEQGDRISAGIAIATRQTERLATLVDMLLDASRMSAGRLELRADRFDLTALVREVADRLAPAAHKAGSPITVRAEGPVVGRWDRLRCEQVAANLLGNAIKYGGGKPITVDVATAGRAARLVVQDCGIGMNAEQRARVFGIFERAVSSRHYGGLGFGLFISRQIVEAHGGRITVTSDVGAGATFVVELPMEEGSEGAEPEAA